MNKYDFRYMLGGKQLASLSDDELQLLKPITLKEQNNHNKVLLVLHGFSSTPAVYRYLLPQINHYDAIVCPVLPGHGDSIARFSDVKAADWISSCSSLCEQLMAQYNQVDVLGLSLGGLLASELARIYPLHHLFLLAPALKLQMNTEFSLKLSRFLHGLGFRYLRSAAGNLVNSDHAEIAYRQLPLSTIIEMLTLAQHYHWQPPSCPTDIFLGAHDQVVNSKKVEHLFKPLAHATIHWLDNSAHVLPLDNDVAEIIECINNHAAAL